MLKKKYIIHLVYVCSLGILLLQVSGCKKKAQDKASAHVAQPAAFSFPVKVDKSYTRDVPVTLRVIGHLQSPNLVQLVPQVSGEVVEIVPKDGAMVKTGDLLVRIDPTPFLGLVEQVQGNIMKDEANLQYAKEQLKSYAALVPQNFVAPLTMAQYQAAVLAAEGQLLSDKGALVYAQAQLGFTELRAPVDGIFGLVQVTVGNVFNLSYSNPFIATVAQVSPIDAILNLPEIWLDTVKNRQKEAPLKIVISFSSPTQPQLEGELIAIDNVVNAQTGTINIKARFKNENLDGWPGQFVRGELQMYVNKDAVVVPTLAIQVGAKGKFVYVVTKDNTVKMQEVVTGVATDEWTEIKSGLEANTEVVTVGQLNLYPDAPVNITHDLTKDEHELKSPSMHPSKRILRKIAHLEGRDHS